MHPRQTKISPLQLVLLLVPGIASTAILGLPGTTAAFARQDAWMAPLVALPAAVLVIWICGRLAVRFPEETFAEYAPRVLGKVPGKLCGLLLFWYFFHLSAAISREFADFLVATAHPRTPMVLIVGIAAFATGVAVRQGPEVLARLGVLFTPPGIALVFLIIALAYASTDARLLQPVLENGWRPVLTSGFLTQAFMGQFVLLVVLLPSVNRREQGIKAGYITAGIIAALISLVSLVTVSVFGPLTDKLVWPFFKVARVASFGVVLARIDPLVLGFWVAGACLKLAVHLYAAVVTFAHVVGLRDWRPIVFAMSALVGAYAAGHLDSFIEHGYMLAYFWPPYTQVFQLVLPALVLLVASVRRVEATSVERGEASPARRDQVTPAPGAQYEERVSHR